MSRPPYIKPLFPKAQPTDVQDTLFPSSEAVNLDPSAFDQAIHTQGMTFVHWRALKCPIGVVDPDDERHPHGDHQGCSNGFLYRVVAQVTCLPSNNSNNPQVQDLGIVNQVNLMVTAPRFYDVLSAEGEPMRVLLAPYDRFYLAEDTITVIQWQLFEASGAPTDKLDYPVVAVEHMVDSLGRDLVEGQDFAIRDGLIAWLPGGKAPVRNPDAGTGGVASCRYRYRPYWYIKDLPHEIRITQGADPLTGERVTVRMQQQALLQREYVFENQTNDPKAAPPTGSSGAPAETQPLAKALGQSNLRTVLGARGGGFGPR